MDKNADKKRCWIVVGDLVELKSNRDMSGTVTKMKAGAFATWVEVLWNNGMIESVPIGDVELVGEVNP